MTAKPVFLSDRIFASRAFRSAALRRAVLLGGVLAFGVLALYPQHYRAVAKLVAPIGAPSASGASSEGAAYGAFIVSQTSERSLAVARSYDVALDVVQRLNIVGHRNGYPTLERALAQFDDRVDAQILRGGVLQIDARDRDPAFAMAMTDAYVAVLQTRQAVAVLESTHLDLERQWNAGWLAAAGLLAIIAVFFEFYYLSSDARRFVPRERDGSAVD